MAESLTPRSAVVRMASYSPPTGGRAGKIRLDFNENTVGCSPKVVECLRRWVTADALTIYPEYTAALEELARYFGVAPEEFTLTNGTDEAIQLLLDTFVDAGGEVLLLKVEALGPGVCHEGYESCFFRRLDGDEWKTAEARTYDPGAVYGS
jgi:histidinol-phosphate aminotransferase